MLVPTTQLLDMNSIITWMDVSEDEMGQQGWDVTDKVIDDIRTVK